MLIGEDLWKYLEERGQTRHKHSNGLMSCHECAMIVLTGKTKQELEDEWEKQLKEVSKATFGADE